MKKLRLATVGLVSIKREIIESETFLSAKKGDTEAAIKIVDLVWRENKTDELSNNITKETVFLSVPSTTKLNVLPIVLADSLSRKLSCQFVSGDDLFLTAHNRASKNIPRDMRVLSPREYEIFDIEKTKQLKDKNIIIVDDIITTGSSIRNFFEFLNKNDFKVSHVVALMGDRRLELDEITEKKLELALLDKKIDIPVDSINYITRTEAGGLIRRLNGLRSKDGIEKFTGEIRKLQRDRSAENIRGAANRRWDLGTTGNDFGHGETGERIPTYTSSPSFEHQQITSTGRSFVVKTTKDGLKQPLVDFIKTLPEKTTGLKENLSTQTRTKLDQIKRSSALENLARNIRIGSSLNPKDIKNLSHKDIEGIKEKGEKHLEDLVKENTKERGCER